MTIDRALLKASWRSWYAWDLRPTGPAWLQWVWTFLFSCVIGVGFFVLSIAFRMLGGGGWPTPSGFARWLLAHIVVSLVIGCTIHALSSFLLTMIGAHRIRALKSWQRGLYFGGVPLLGTALGWPAGMWLAAATIDGIRSPFTSGRSPALAATALLLLLLVFVFFLHFDAKARQFEAEKRATEAQLRLLQGQMEPHFMFNTLGTVLSLVDTDTARARLMLEAFIDYLRATLGKLRTQDSTLGDELAMAQAFLSLMHFRMGDRLAFRIDLADSSLRSASMPPLLLQPLVENAIHHGLENKVEGGTVRVAARRQQHQLVIDVEDDGLGHAAAARPRIDGKGNGVALRNLRERLSSRYGNDAGLELTLLPEGGARATLRLPFEAVAGEAPAAQETAA
jgi:Histidine kinase